MIDWIKMGEGKGSCLVSLDGTIHWPKAYKSSIGLRCWPMMLWGLRWVWRAQMHQGDLWADRIYVGLELRGQASARGTDFGISTAYRRWGTWQRIDSKEHPSQTEPGELPSAQAPELSALHPSPSHPSDFSGFPEAIHARLPFFPFRGPLKDILCSSCGWQRLLRTQRCSSSWDFCCSQDWTLKVTSRAVLSSGFAALTHAR